MKDFNKLINECKEELDKINIPYARNIEFKINTRAKSRWGRAKLINGDYVIEISKTLLDDTVPDYGTKNTIIHEILHTCPDGMTHKGKWKEYANIVNNYYGYNITRCSSAESKGVNKELQVERIVKHNKTYICKCSKCGLELRRHKMSKFVKYPEYFTHKGCSGHFERIA